MENKTVIFVCSGNTCRSPMAEALFKAGLTDKEKQHITVKSYGFSAFSGDTAAENAISVMREKGIDISTHRSSQLNNYYIDSADVIVSMTGQLTLLLLRAGAEREKIITLNISDPFGGTLDDYRRCADEIENKLEAVYDRIR